MNSEIRASHVLASLGLLSGSADLSLQNPLFSQGAENAFPQVLKEQVSDRQEPARSAGVSEIQQERQAASARRDVQARDRQPGGKDLPESTARSNDVRERPRATDDWASEVYTQSSKAELAIGVEEKSSIVEAAAGVESAVASPQDNVVAKTGESAVDALDEAQRLAIAVVPVDQLPQQDIRVDVTGKVVQTTLESSLALEQPFVDGVLQVETEPAAIQADANLMGEMTDVSTGQQREATETLSFAQFVGATIAAIDKSNKVSFAAATSTAVVAGTTTEMMSNTASSDSVAHTEQLVVMTAQSETVSSERARSLADALTGLHQLGEDNAAFQPSEDGELGAEVSRVEKNAEARAELSRQLLSAGGERQQGIRDQLAALVQQVTGAADQTQKQADQRKLDAANDVKPTVFSRTLEQFSVARTEVGKPVSTGIQTPVGQREWAGELGQRLVMMVSSKLKFAEIHLNPKELGPVEVRIRMHEDKAHVVFSSQVPQTRDALEQAVPRLREMLDQNGVALGNVDVRDQGTQQSHTHDQLGRNFRGQGGDDASADAGVEATVVSHRVVGLVDYYV